MNKILCILLITLGSQMLLQTAKGQTFTVTPSRAYNYVNGIGVNVHLRFHNVYYYSFDTIIFPKLKKLGVKYIRDAVPYSNFLSVADTGLIKNRFIKLHDSLGIKVSYLLDSKMVPDSAGLRDSANYLSVFASTPGLSATVGSLEGFNEPDLTIYGWYPANWDTLTYTIQKSLWNKAKSMPALSGVPITAPSFVSYWNGRPDKVASMAPHINTYFDFANYHTYDAGASDPTFFPGFTYDWNKQNTHMDSIGRGYPWVETELGYENALNWNLPSSPGYIPSTYHYLSELACGKYYSVLFMEMFRRGAQRVYGYEFIDQNTADQSNSENNFGLIHTDGTEKPAFTAIKNTISILRDDDTTFTPNPLTYTLTGAVAGINNALYQKKNGHYYLALWQNKDSGRCYKFLTFTDLPPDSQQVKVILPFVASKVKVYQPLVSGDPIYTWCDKDTLTVNVPDHLLLMDIDPSWGQWQGKTFPGNRNVRLTVASPPNPNNVHISLYTREPGKGIIEIYNSAGVVVARKPVTTAAYQNDYDIPCQLTPGIYIAVFRYARGAVTQKFVQ